VETIDGRADEQPVIFLVNRAEVAGTFRELFS
jgi:hypothetical protein